MTQRIASSRLDLPQPLGPTIPVKPGSMRNSAGSTKLLKPLSLSRLISMDVACLPVGAYLVRAPARCRTGSSLSHWFTSSLLPLSRKVGVPVIVNSLA